MSNNLFLLGRPIPQLDPFTDVCGLAATILGEEAASTPEGVQNIMNLRSFVFGTKNGYDQDFPTTDGCGASPTPPAPTTPSPTTPPPAPGDCTSYTNKGDCNNAINCVWSGHPSNGSCGDGGDSAPPPSPTPGQDCPTCSGLGGGACNSCPNCSWGGGKLGCQG